MKKPINVLHISSVLTGAAFFNNLWDYSDRQKVNYTFATFTKEGDFSRQLEERGATVYKMDATKKDDTIDWFDLPKAYKRLVNIIEKEKIDIIHPHLFFPTLLGVNVAKLKGRKSVFTRHHSDAHHVLKSFVKRKFYLMLEKLINCQANHIVAPSRTVRDMLVKKEGVSAEKISLIPYGQVLDRFTAVTPEVVAEKRKELGINDRQLSMVCISRLFPTKGHIYLFEALAPLFKEGLQAKLYVVGDGDYRSVLEKKVEDLKIKDSVVFLGWRGDILPVNASADIIVHPSLEDALSQTLIESLMLEKPIVATDISGAGDTLGDGKYGRLVKPADPADLRKGIEETIENLDLAHQKAKAGKDYLLEYMSAERVSSEYEKVYEKVMSEHRAIEQ